MHKKINEKDQKKKVKERKQVEEKERGMKTFTFIFLIIHTFSPKISK